MFKNSVILFDLAHNEMLDIFDNNFSNFFNLLKNLGFKIEVNNNKNITAKVLQNINFLILGNPINDYFSNLEIMNIIKFVRTGGRLFLISEYGSDYIQKTNLNDIGQHFGIVFNKNIVKEDNNINENCSSILSIHKFSDHKIMNQIRELRIAGTCSLNLNKPSMPIIFSNESWTEFFNESSNIFIKNIENRNEIIAACTEYGKGKVIAIGDIDIFTNDTNFGINLLDNRNFIMNCLTWLLKSVKKSDITLWTLNQVGSMHNEIKDINIKLNNIIETLTYLEYRISEIENQRDINKDNKKIKNEIFEDEISQI